MGVVAAQWNARPPRAKLHCAPAFHLANRVGGSFCQLTLDGAPIGGSLLQSQVAQFTPEARQHLNESPLSESPQDQYLKWCLANPGKSTFVDVAGNKIHVLEWSAAVQSSRPATTLLLVHGFMGHAHWWDFVAPALAHDYRVLAMDLGGMGDSGYRSEYSLANYVDEIAGVIRTMTSGKVVVVGHSFGGRCTILTAHAHPELMDRIVIVDSHVGFPDEHRQRRFNRRPRREKKYYPDLASGKARFRLVPEETGTHPLILDHMAEHSLKRELHDGVESYVWKFDEAVMDRLPKPELTDAEALPQLRVPMDFVCGEKSVVAPAEHAAKVAAAIPRGRAPIVVPAAYHHVPLGQPLALTSVLRALLVTER